LFSGFVYISKDKKAKRACKKCYSQEAELFKGKLYFGAILLSLVTLIVASIGGCARQPEGVKGPKQISEGESQRIAEDFVRNSPTYVFDGIEGTLRLINTVEVSSPYTWTFVFYFESRHAGYGDRTGQMLAQVITPHKTSITVEQGEITCASMDEKWDMIKQEELFSHVDPGTVVIKGEANLVGWILETKSIGENGNFGRILVEAQADKVADRYWVTITDKTLIFEHDEKILRRISFEALATKTQAQIWFSGPVKESYPAQVDAEQVVIIK
jgi:hypothetical protein